MLVKYRVSSQDSAGFQFPVPLVEARRAIRVTRARAEEWGVDPSKIGVMVSTAMRVDPKTPPCFLIYAADDGAVPVRNSLEFAARCVENKVPVVCHVFAQGGHGFGLKGKGDSMNWPDRFEEWLVSGKLANGS